MTQCSLLTLLCTLTSDDIQYETTLTASFYLSAAGQQLKTSVRLSEKKQTKTVQRNVCK